MKGKKMGSSNWNQVRRVSRSGGVTRVEMPKSAMYITPSKRVVYTNGKTYKGTSSSKNITSYATNGFNYVHSNGISKLGYGVKRRVFSHKELAPAEKQVSKPKIAKKTVSYNKVDLKKFVFKVNKMLGNKLYYCFFMIKYHRGDNQKKDKKKKLCLRSSKKIFKSVFMQTAYCGLISSLDSILKNRVYESFSQLKNPIENEKNTFEEKKREITTTGKKRRKISMKIFLGFLTRLMKIVDSKYKRIVFLKIKANYFRSESHVKNVRLFGDILNGLFSRKNEFVKKEFFEENVSGLYGVDSSSFVNCGGSQIEFGYYIAKIEEIMKVKAMRDKSRLFNQIVRGNKVPKAQYLSMIETMRYQNKRRMALVSLNLLSRLLNKGRKTGKRLAFSKILQKKSPNIPNNNIKHGLKQLIYITRLKKNQKTNQGFKQIKTQSLKMILAEQRNHQPKIKKKPIRAQRTSSKIVITSNTNTNTNTRKVLHDNFNNYVASARSKSSQPSDPKPKQKAKPFTRKLSTRNELSSSTQRNLRNSYSNMAKPAIKYSHSSKHINPLLNNFSRSDNNFFQSARGLNKHASSEVYKAPPEPSETYSVDLREKLNQIYFENKKKRGALVPKLTLSNLETPR